MALFSTYNLCCPSFMATHMCVCSEKFVAVPLNERGNVAVWKTESPLEKPITLIGHHKIVTALDLSCTPTDDYLCTCSSDNIIIWNLLENGGNPSKGKVIHSHMEQPLFCRFSSDTSKIAFSFPSGMWIFDLQESSWFISIEESYFIVFSFTNNHKILGIKEIYLKSWDLKVNEIITNMNITPGFPSALCIHAESGIIVVGTTCGHLNIYGENYNIIRNIQIWKLLSQHQKIDSNDEGSCKDYGSDSFPIFSIQTFKGTGYAEAKSENFLPQIVYLLIVTSTCILILNINNEEIVFYLDFNDFDSENVNRRIGLVSFASISCSPDISVAHINVIPVMCESLILIKLLLEEIKLSYEQKLRKSETNFQKPFFTFINSVSEKCEKSLLVSKVRNSLRNKNIKKVTSNLNLPVTFHSNIKSSGYGTLHKPVVLFQPKILKTYKVKSDFSLPMKFEKNCSKEKNIFKHNVSPIRFEKIVYLDKIKTCENPMMSSLQISVDGKYASSTSSDGSIDILKLEKKRIKMFHTINAHKGQVKNAKWSHSDKLLVSGGKDKTVKIWNLEKQQPLLTIGVSKDEITGMTKSKFVFETAIEQAQFYYLDHFILAATGNNVYLFEYVINLEKSGIKNVLCAGSSKCIDIIDMAVGKVVAHMEDTSSRPPYLISLNEGSPYSSHTPSMYDLFLTASQYDGIKLWDLRTNWHVLSYKEHKSRSYPCAANFSPCGKYIATGSEDKSVYIYDLRQLTHVHKFSDQQTDVFTSVAFSPQSQLLTSSLNGLVYLYGQID